MLCINNNLKLCKFEGCLGSYFYLQNEKDFSLAACKGSTLKKKKTTKLRLTPGLEIEHY